MHRYCLDQSSLIASEVVTQSAYYPLTTANEMWRIDPSGGGPERVTGGRGVPNAVKFDPQGHLVSTQVASGQVLRVDPRTGDKGVFAQLNPGPDKPTFVTGRLFIPNLTGQITEVLGGGRDTQRAGGCVEVAAGSGGRRCGAVADGEGSVLALGRS